MPVRATKRGDERTPIDGTHDVVVCGASFAGLAVARELAGSGADVLIVDRYEIGERQTSACAAPTEWLRALGLEDSMRQTFGELVVHTPHTTVRLELAVHVLHLRLPDALPDPLVRLRGDVRDRQGRGPLGGRDRGGDDRHPHGPRRGPRPAGRRRPRLAPGPRQRRQRAAPRCDALARASRSIPGASGDDLEIWIERDVVPAGYGWSFPATDEVRVGVGSFDPRHHVKEPTVALAERLEVDAVRYQGNWIPHRLRPATDAGVFFAGDSAGHCLPLTAEGIRTAWYFGIACGRELREVHAGRKPRAAALADYAAFSSGHRWKFEAMLGVQRLVPRVPPRLLARVLDRMENKRFLDWSFGHYLEIAPPSFAGPPRPRATAAPEPAELAA